MTGLDDENVARSRLSQGAMDPEIISARRANRERWSGQPHRRIQRRENVGERASPTCGLVHGRNANPCASGAKSFASPGGRIGHCISPLAYYFSLFYPKRTI
jgi:hypothetical protein